MSRDLGTNQTRLLRALAALEREHDTGSRFYVWAVIEQVYKDPPDLQEIEKRQQECVAADRQWWEDLAASGNDQAKRYLALGRPLRRTRRSPQWRRKFPSWVEDTLIPSRVLASVEARGLV
jgi:hypothetical protein